MLGCFEPQEKFPSPITSDLIHSRKDDYAITTFEGSGEFVRPGD